MERYSAGSANLRSGRPISPRDFARVVGVTKTFTATVVQQLVAEGKLGIGDSIQRWLPGLVPHGDRITVRELLNHTSGIADYCNVPPGSTLCDPGGNGARRWTQRQLVEIGAGAPPLCPPGQGWSHSNTAYVLLGMIIERVTGHTAAKEYERRILRPLGLRHTEFRTTTSMPRPYSHGYDVVSAGSWPSDVTATSPTIAWSSGAIVSTVGDLETFMRALLGGRLVSRSLLREMKRPTPGSLAALQGQDASTYGLGLQHFTWSSGCGVWGPHGRLPRLSHSRHGQRQWATRRRDVRHLRRAGAPGSDCHARDAATTGLQDALRTAHRLVTEDHPREDGGSPSRGPGQ